MPQEEKSRQGFRVVRAIAYCIRAFDKNVKYNVFIANFY
jgi:hypothetical protein